jgi:hypothetical protein
MITPAIRKLFTFAMPLLSLAMMAKADTISSYSLGNATGALTGTNGAVVESGMIGGPLTLTLGIPFTVTDFFTPVLEPCSGCANNTYTAHLTPVAFSITDSTLSQTVNASPDFNQTFTDTVTGGGATQVLAAGTSTSAVFLLKNGTMITVTPQANASPGNVSAIFLLSNAVPEPSTWTLMLCALAGLVGLRVSTRRRSAASSY